METIRMKKNVLRSLSLLLMLSFVLGLAVPSANVMAADKAKKKKVLVAYFSATGTTRAAAKKVKKATGGTLYQIKAADPYTAADLTYDKNCRANAEQSDENVRPAIKGKVKKMEKYDVIFLGYPIWWGKEPKIIRTFLESYNLKGKKIVTFCTSGGSGISGSMKEVKQSAKGAKVIKGKDLTDWPYKQVAKWTKSVN